MQGHSCKTPFLAFRNYSNCRSISLQAKTYQLEVSLSSFKRSEVYSPRFQLQLLQQIYPKKPSLLYFKSAPDYFIIPKSFLQPDVTKSVKHKIIHFEIEAAKSIDCILSSLSRDWKNHPNNPETTTVKPSVHRALSSSKINYNIFPKIH